MGNLILTRGVGSRIVIGGDIFVEVVEIRGQLVKLGVLAPDDVSVDREELYLLKRRAAAQLPAASVNGVKVKG